MSSRQPSRPVPPTQGLTEAAGAQASAADGDRLQREAPMIGERLWFVLTAAFVAILAMGGAMALLIACVEEITGGRPQ